MAEATGEQKPETGDGTIKGEVISFNREKSFGIIHILTGDREIGTASHEDAEARKKTDTLFFNARTLAPGTDIKDIAEGTRVSLDITIGRNGPLAVNVKKASDK